MTKEEIVQLFDDYINEKGLFFDFKEWVENQGYTLTELGIPEE